MKRRNVLQLNIEDLYGNVLDLRRAVPVSALREGKKIADIVPGHSSAAVLPAGKIAAHSALAVRNRAGLARSLSRAVAMFLIITLNWIGLSAIGTTISTFNDSENSAQNPFEAGVLDFSLEVEPFSNTAWVNMETGTTTAQSVGVLPHSQSNPFWYYASSTDFTGDVDFCGALLVRAELVGDEMYNGALTDLYTATTTVLDTWIFEFSTEENFANMVCHFNIDFNGWQTRHDHPSYEEGGFKDTERVPQSIYSPGLRINKVYVEEDEGGIHTGDSHASSHVENHVNENETEVSMCECDDPLHDTYGDDDEAHCDDGGGNINIENNNDAGIINNVESSSSSGGNSATGGNGAVNGGWVELYNQTGVPVDVSGWSICDNSSCDDFGASGTIPPNGFAVIAGSEYALSEVHVPSDFVKIILPDGHIGNGLSTTTDMLVLKRPDGEIMDQMNWGEPNASWPNYNPQVWTPGVTPPQEGNVLARVPSGYDTNSPDDWQELGFPAGDLIFPDEGGNYTWYAGTTYNIEWGAINQNGADGELSINLYYIKDTNGNGLLDAGDTVDTIAEDTENDGIHQWTVPEGLVEGYMWIRLVATGPENPLLNGKTVSGKIWDPVPVVPVITDEGGSMMEENTEESNDGASAVIQDNANNTEDDSAVDRAERQDRQRPQRDGGSLDPINEINGAEQEVIPPELTDSSDYVPDPEVQADTEDGASTDGADVTEEGTEEVTEGENNNEQNAIGDKSATTQSEQGSGLQQEEASPEPDADNGANPEETEAAKPDEQISAESTDSPEGPTPDPEVKADTEDGVSTDGAGGTDENPQDPGGDNEE